jgi:acetyl-CoA decarbonylase/synthase complex subunit gamma
MALSGLEIFKLLPKTNCGECGIPTCMAFAMKLAQKKAELSECPYASEEAKDALGAASEPPIKLVKIGKAQPVETGNETVMFRHEKTFFHQTAIAVQIRSSENQDKLGAMIKEVTEYKVERVGEELAPDLFFVTYDNTDTDKFLKLISDIKQLSPRGIIIDCADSGTLSKGLELIKGENPAIFLKEKVTDIHIDLAKSYSASIIITDSSMEGLSAQAEKVKNAGVNSIILNLDFSNTGDILQNNTILRRSALKKNYKPFGYPLFTYIGTDNNYDLLAKASLCICKYSSIIVLPFYDKALLYTLLTLRQNIFTDPQKPIQVEPKIYSIGEPVDKSPVFVTTNFSLTYFIVSGEIENAGVSAYLVVCDCEGQSVLTAWAAGKFTGKQIARFVNEIKLEEKVKTRKIIIPGFVSQISGELEESLPGWEVIVGCQEASDISSFVKNVNIA